MANFYPEPHESATWELQASELQQLKQHVTVNGHLEAVRARRCPAKKDSRGTNSSGSFQRVPRSFQISARVLVLEVKGLHAR